jgi:hypothetical protein
MEGKNAFKHASMASSSVPNLFKEFIVFDGGIIAISLL